MARPNTSIQWRRTQSPKLKHTHRTVRHLEWRPTSNENHNRKKKSKHTHQHAHDAHAHTHTSTPAHTCIKAYTHKLAYFLILGMFTNSCKNAHLSLAMSIYLSQCNNSWTSEQTCKQCNNGEFLPSQFLLHLNKNSGCFTWLSIHNTCNSLNVCWNTKSFQQKFQRNMKHKSHKPY